MQKLGLLLIVAVGAACTSKEPPPANDRTGSQVAGAGSLATKPEPAGPAAGAAGGSAAGPVAGAGGSATGPVAGAAGGSAADGIVGGNMTGPLKHHAANCPSWLPDTTTRLEMTPRGVDVSVTSKDRRVARRIVELALYHASGLTAVASRPHDQKHGGPAWIGYCPIIVSHRTKVTMTPIRHGATLHVNARSPRLVSELQEVIKARAARLPGYASS